MSRLKADLLLLLVALIWGVAFVPQKFAFAHIGACTFVAARFALSAVLVFPFAWREWREKKPWRKFKSHRFALLGLLAAFSGGVILQQEGLASTSVTNAGFLTGLYVLFVPIICRIFYRQRLSVWIYPAALLSLVGTWCLSGGTLTSYSPGDSLVILCAVCCGIHVAMLGTVSREMATPLCIAFLQYFTCAAVAAVGVFGIEHPAAADLMGALWPILYAGVLSGGVAYTLQAVAQQYAPASDAAIIMSGESLFAAVAGAVLMSERLTLLQYTGCALIVLAILMAEVAPLFKQKARRAAS